MSVTQTNLLIVLMVKADYSMVKVLDEVFELYPEYPVQIVIDSYLLERSLELVRHVLPLKLPFSFSSGTVRIPNLNQANNFLIFTCDSQGRQDCICVMVS